MPKALTVLEMAKLIARHDKERIRACMKRMSYRTGKGDMIPWIVKHYGSPWAERVGFFPVTDDWYPSWTVPDHELKYVKAVLYPVDSYVSIRFAGADDSSHTFNFSSMVEAEVFWEQLEAEPELCFTMIQLLHEPFSA